MTEQIEQALYAAYMLGATMGMDRISEFKPADMLMLSDATNFACNVINVLESKSTLAS